MNPTYAHPGPPPTRQRDITVLNVRHFGAWGDGAHDDTRAIACALEQLGPRGGSVLLPTGVYCINPNQLVLPSRTRLASADATRPAQLRALPSRAGREALLRLSGHDIEITDLMLIGNRDDGLGTEDERGHGIYIQGARAVTLARVTVQRCWGDGVSIGASEDDHPAEDIWLEDVWSDHNRRQGLSIGRARAVTVHGGSYSRTGKWTDDTGQVWPGTSPSSGIDVEPDLPGNAQDIRILGVTAADNDGFGIQVYRRSQDGGHSLRVTIAGCSALRNSVGITAYGGKDTAGASAPGIHTLHITGNRAHGNRATGIRIETGVEDYLIEANVLGSNYGSTRVREAAAASGALKAYESDLLLRTGLPASTGVVGANFYEAQPAG